MPFVYSATNTITGKQYIGICASKVRRRWRRHVNSAQANKPRNRNCPAFHAAIRKYGEAAFVVEALYQAVDWLEACKVERGIIAERGTLAPRGYNLTSGGEGRLGFKPTPEHRKRSSEWIRANPVSSEQRVRMTAHRRGTKVPDDELALMSARMKARWADPEYRQRQSAALAQGRAGSEAVRAANAKRFLGHAHSAETRAKMSARQIGKTLSPETRAKISVAALTRSGRISPK